MYTYDELHDEVEDLYEEIPYRFDADEIWRKALADGRLSALPVA